MKLHSLRMVKSRSFEFLASSLSSPDFISSSFITCSSASSFLCSSGSDSRFSVIMFSTNVCLISDLASLSSKDFSSGLLLSLSFRDWTPESPVFTETLVNSFSKLWEELGEVLFSIKLSVFVPSCVLRASSSFGDDLVSVSWVARGLIMIGRSRAPHMIMVLWKAPITAMVCRQPIWSLNAEKADDDEDDVFSECLSIKLHI